MVCGGGRERGRERERMRYLEFLEGRADGKHNNGENMRNEEDEKQGVTTERLSFE